MHIFIVLNVPGPKYGHLYIKGKEINMTDVVDNMTPERKKLIEDSEEKYGLSIEEVNGKIYLNSVMITYEELFSKPNNSYYSHLLETCLANSENMKELSKCNDEHIVDHVDKLSREAIFGSS